MSVISCNTKKLIKVNHISGLSMQKYLTDDNR